MAVESSAWTSWKAWSRGPGKRQREKIADSVEFRVADAQALPFYAGSPTYRRFVKGVREGGVVPENLADYFGYGLFVGQK
jgi:hypothetical protein